MVADKFIAWAPARDRSQLDAYRATAVVLDWRIRLTMEPKANSPGLFMLPRQIVSLYFFVQAFSTLVWWGCLWAYPDCIGWFQPKAWPAAALMSFWLADFLLIILGSIVVGVATWTSHPMAKIAVWSVALVTWYPTLVCIATSILTDEAWLAASMMVAMAGLSLAMATIYGNADQTPETIRVVPMTRRAAWLWTMGQVVIFWSVFLWILPLGIIEIEQRVGMARFHVAFQSELASILFVCASTLGLWSAQSMALQGDGTPLPTATAPRLVVTGPYRFLRNPMALAGILQGLAVGWYQGSVAVIAYSLMGAIVWHCLVRPVEERDLALRFGDQYDRYRARVGLWVPTFSRLNLER